jgi:16S rRNA (uracil1498-N3)-methyltransferase
MKPPLRVPMTPLSPGETRLSPSVARYVAVVHRLQAGGSFVAFDPARGLEADAEIVQVEGGLVVARLGELRESTRAATRDVLWIQALPKGDRMDAIVRDLTELGATRVVPVRTAFSLIKLSGEREATRQARWSRIASEAARQCGRGDAPVVMPVTEWADALESARQANAVCFCLHEKSTAPLGPPLALAVSLGGPLAFAAGPEGGLSDDEVALASSLGFAVVSLGPFVLRSETVAAATLGALRVVEGLTSPTQSSDRSAT